MSSRCLTFACVLLVSFCGHAVDGNFPATAAALREKMRAALFVPAPLPPLQAEKLGEFSPAPGVIAEKICYRTEYGMLIPAVVYRPEKAGERRPALMVVNGHGGDKYSWYAFYSGILYARGGAVVLTYDPAGEGERNRDRKSGTRAHDHYVPPPEMGRRMGGLMMTDVMQGVSYLSQRADVDPARIGAMGYSMGSFVVSLAGAVETRLRVCVPTGGGNLDGPGGYWETSSKKMCQALPYQAMAFLGDRAAVIYALHALRGPTLVYNGAQDDVVGLPALGEPLLRDLRARVVKLLGSAGQVFSYDFTPAAGHRPYFVTKPVALWLQQQLHLPDWTEAAIKSAPETHIFEWSIAHQVAMDRGYTNELREGGTLALGKDVPNVAREKLHVFSDAQWAERKDQLVLETWIKRALAEVAPTAVEPRPGK